MATRKKADDGNTPVNGATPAPESPSAPVTTPTDAFVREELSAAQLAYKRTKIYGTVIFLALALETIAVSARFALALQPHEAATIASGFVSDQLDQHSDAIEASLKDKIPQMIEQSPDYVIQELPNCRQTLEENVNKNLSTYTQSTAAALGTQMDTYIDQNKDQIQEVLSKGSDPTAAAQLGPSLRKALEAYLAEKPASGESVQDQVDKSLSMLKDVQSKMDHLAKDSNLTPTDLQTRHALAVIASSVTHENLQPIPLKDAIPPPVVADNPAVPAAPAAPSVH